MNASLPTDTHGPLPPTPTAFGRRLIHARETRGLSLADAAHETRIRARELRWLEEGNIAAFGCMTYARSFVRAYSTFLQIDATTYLRSLPARGALGGSRDYRYLTESHGAWLREHECASPSRLRAAPQAPVLQQIKSPIPAGVRAFAVMLAATAFWGMHLADVHADVKSYAPVKPLPKALDYVHTREHAPLHVSVSPKD